MIITEPFNQQTAIDSIRYSGLVSILRGVDPNNVCDVVNILREEGVRQVEVTIDTPDTLQLIKRLSQAYSDEMLIGAGTVLDEETASEAISAGARFILTATLDPQVITFCQEKRVLPIPGVFTPQKSPLHDNPELKL